ncbi:MAG: hypothetical protein AAFQ36_09400 [Pseudomonadota bacterium]
MPTPPLTDLEAAETKRIHTAARKNSEEAVRMWNEAHPEKQLTPFGWKSRVQMLRRTDRWDDPAIAEAKLAVGTHMTPRLAWVKTKNEDGTSHSVLLRPDDEGEGIIERLQTAFDDLPAATPIPTPDTVADDLCTLYPLFDVHAGMLADSRETGGDAYDVKRMVADMRYATGKVMAMTPASVEAILLIGGDFFHADDNRAETPASRHKLDVDGRHYKVLNAGVEVMAETIERLLTKHQSVCVRVLRGNHDPHSHLVLTVALSQRYRDEPRIAVDTSPQDLFYIQWGRNLIAAHHGDRQKPEGLAFKLADCVPFWSECRFRFVFTGHIHTGKMRDLGAIQWESLRAFCPPDAYGAQFAGRREAQAVTFHKQDGLVMRVFDPIERRESA